MSADGLNERILAGHEAGDAAALAALYSEAADAANSVDAACFFLTHAYVWALDAGDPLAADLHARLCAHGRESGEAPVL